MKANAKDYNPLITARAFIEKFGFREITIDEFDVFIIDSGLATDPGTEDTKDPGYRMFVGERSKAKHTLNKEGPNCDEGSRFQVRVLQAGKVYLIEHYTDAMIADTVDMGNTVRKFTEGQVGKREKAVKQLTQLHNLHGDDRDLEDALRAQEHMNVFTITFEKKVRELAFQYNTGVKAAEEMARLALEKYEGEGLALIDHIED